LRLTIEKLIYGGDGLARLPADEYGKGKAVFVPFVLPGETIEASVTGQKAGFVRATAETVLEPSSHRIRAGCPYFGSCGGCQYQHTSYEQQLEIKKGILRETLLRTAKLELSSDIHVHPSPPWNYRNRSRLQVQSSPTFAVGYFQSGSHQVVPVEECPISSPLINRGIAALLQNGRAGKVPQGVREVEFFANADDTLLLAEVLCHDSARRSVVRMWAEELRASLPAITGIVAFREPNSRERHKAKPELLVTTGNSFLLYQTRLSAFRVSAGSFFQTNRHLIDELVDLVIARASGNQALDLYAGVGLFSTALAGDMRHVVSVESSQTSSDDLAYNRSSNGKTVLGTTEQYLARVVDQGRVGKGALLPHTHKKPDLAVVDPPRSGLGERVARLLATLGAPRVVYVSCDPATLARDLVILIAAGYRIEQVHLVDLFPQTYHVESVVHLVSGTSTQ